MNDPTPYHAPAPVHERALAERWKEALRLLAGDFGALARAPTGAVRDDGATTGDDGATTPAPKGDDLWA
jgi:hypothetical protein